MVERKQESKLSDDEVEEVLDWILEEMARTYVDPGRIGRLIDLLMKYSKAISVAIGYAVKDEFRDFVDEVMEVLNFG